MWPSIAISNIHGEICRDLTVLTFFSSVQKFLIKKIELPKKSFSSSKEQTQKIENFTINNTKKHADKKPNAHSQDKPLNFTFSI